VTPPSLRHTFSSSIPWLLALSFGALSHVGLWFAAEPRIHVVPIPPVPTVVTAPATCPPVEPSPMPVASASVDERAVGTLEPIVDVDDAVRCPEENLCIIDRALVQALLAQRAPHVWRARIVPSIRDGETIGLKVYGVREGTLPAALGLRSGDLLRAINGRPLTSMGHAAEAYSTLRQASWLALELLRKDERIIKHYRIE
jgi:hypothetical protein